MSRAVGAGGPWPHQILADQLTLPQLGRGKQIMPATLGTIQVLPHQRGGWVGSENGNFGEMVGCV